MRTAIIWIGLIAFAVALTANQSVAQEASDSLRTRVLAKLESLAETDGQGSSPIRENYSQALQALDRAAIANERAKQYFEDTVGLPEATRVVRSQLDDATATVNVYPDTTDLTLAQIEDYFREAQSDLVSAHSQLDESTKTAQFRALRLTYIPEELAVLAGLRTQLKEGLQNQSQTSEGESLQTLLLAKDEEFDAKSRLLEAETANYEARREYLLLTKDLAIRSVKRAESEVEHWLPILELRQAENAETSAAELEQEVDQLLLQYPRLKDYGVEIKKLALIRLGENGLPQQLSRARLDLQKTNGQLRSTISRHSGASRRISAGGLNESSGIILRRDYVWLQPVAEINQDAATLQDRLASVQLELIEIEEQREASALGERPLDLLFNELSSQGSEPDVLAAALRLQTILHDLRDQIHDDLTALLTISLEHRAALSSLTEAVNHYREYIEQKILWVKSSTLSPWRSLQLLPEHSSEFLSAAASIPLKSSVNDLIRRHPIQSFFIPLLFIFLLIGRKKISSQLEFRHLQVRSYKTDRFSNTSVALALAGLLALPLPLCLWTTGQIISSSAAHPLWAFGKQVEQISVLWLVLRFLKLIVSKGGIAQVHFRWQTGQLKRVRKELRWFEPIVVITGSFILAPADFEPGMWAETIGRLSFVFHLCAVALFGNRLLRFNPDSPDKLLASASAAPSETSFFRKTSTVWRILVVFIPALLLIATAFGYYFTALQLEQRLRISIGFGLVLFLAHTILMRWLFIARRRLAVSQAYEIQAKRNEEVSDDTNKPINPGTMELDLVDLPTVNSQTQRLFKSAISLATIIGLFFIWSQVFPALENLNHVQVWPKLEIISEATDSDAEIQLDSDIGSAALTADTEAGTEPAVVTLAELLLALLILLGTFVFGKNLPAILELALLQRLPLDSGSRYAISTITRYLIVLLGLGAASNAVGISWEHVQWLVAALTFGLAFGLQEIFANFISGLIILFERPIRVGDIITVGETEGYVTQLRMRATTVQDFDRRELLVPNKEFITQKVVNWTLSDPVTRLVIPVGIAYGSDTKLAREVLLNCADLDSLVLADPAPSAIFRGFGDSSLDFQLRVFLSSRDLWPMAMDQLHARIDAAFRSFGIEIAFPQRDLHIRSYAKEDDPTN